MSKRDGARLRHSVSQGRPEPRVPEPMPEDAPALLVGAHAYVHGCVMEVASVDLDKVLLVTADEHTFAPGLLLRWLGYTWRVCAMMTDPGWSGSMQRAVVIEAWGRDYLTSPKLARYQD